MSTLDPAAATLRAAIWMTGSIASFSAMAVAGRTVSLELDTFEIMFFRSLVGLAVVLAVAGATGGLGRIGTGNLRLHMIRNVSHFTGQNLWFFALTAAPLMQVFALEFTMPIWAMALAVFVLGERLTATRVGLGLVGFLGILVITQPWLGGIGIGAAAAAMAAIGFAGSAVFTRLITRSEAVISVIFWMVAMQAVFGLICAGIDLDIAWPSAAAWPWLVVIGLAGLVAHVCLTTALSLAPATVVAPIDFIRLPVIAIVGMLLYAEPVEAAVLLGAVIIFAANYANIWIESRPPRPA